MPNDFTTADLASWHASRQQLKRIAQRDSPADARRRAGSGFAAGQGGPMPAAAGAPGAHPGAGAYAGAPPDAGADPAAGAGADPADLPKAIEERIEDLTQFAKDLRGADTAGVDGTTEALDAIADLIEEKLLPKLEAVAEKHGEALDELAEQREEEEAAAADEAGDAA